MQLKYDRKMTELRRPSRGRVEEMCMEIEDISTASPERLTLLTEAAPRHIHLNIGLTHTLAFMRFRSERKGEDVWSKSLRCSTGTCLFCQVPHLDSLQTYPTMHEQ
jgi:hypothetical protein